MKYPISNKWQFWIDRGGTFTDVIGKSPNGTIQCAKHLSENPEQYDDAVVFGIRQMLRLKKDEPIDATIVECIKMGTTVGTNALLEHGGEKVALLVSQGFGDLLVIGYQQRPDIFALNPTRHKPLYKEVCEVEERMDANGIILTPLNHRKTQLDLQLLFQKGFRSIAIVLLHAYKYPTHELTVEQIARKVGFTNISVSHHVSPTIKVVQRGETTVTDAYLSPLLKRYIKKIQYGLLSTPTDKPTVPLMFMQSHGGLIDAARFTGKDSILSGPAGGIVGAVQTCQKAGFKNIITFDMGGTSTDVSHYNGEYEFRFETEIAGTLLQCPMLDIHTVAAGGGSILTFDNARAGVGPQSAGANPGPAAYRKGGPLTVTDCNVLLGKVQPAHFPAVFGPNANEPLDVKIVTTKFDALTQKMNAVCNQHKSSSLVAEGYLDIAVENMAQAIKRISIQRGYNVKEYTMCCFGGAGGQHACKVADVLGIRTIFIHPQAGVLSALGMGMADNIVVQEQTVNLSLNSRNVNELSGIFDALVSSANAQLSAAFGSPMVQQRILLKYEGSESTFPIVLDSIASMKQSFENAHRKRFGFIFENKAIFIASAICEVKQKGAPLPNSPSIPINLHIPKARKSTKMFSGGKTHAANVYLREELLAGALLAGPAIIVEELSTIVIEPGWQATVNPQGHCIVEKTSSQKNAIILGAGPDPILLELFNNRFMSVAEQMGYTLQNTAASVNIRERLDFSCALFDCEGNLIANAPHIPVHLGSMSQSVKSIIKKFADVVQPGDAFVLNSPYHGGTHLPDLTVITPIFIKKIKSPIFYVASRGHHADIGGKTPGSIPPDSTRIEQEGILFEGDYITQKGVFLETAIRKKLKQGQWPARNISANIADLQAQVAANNKGTIEIIQLLQQFGRDVVLAYMHYVKQNAEQAVRQELTKLKDGKCTIQIDTGDHICVAIQINAQQRNAHIDFSGTSEQNLKHNFNAPRAIAEAAVLYVFRTLTQHIPLNAGCLVPLQITIPPGSLLHPTPPAAVVAGNVETSQHIVDALYGALGILASSQGTMNNFTFGNDTIQYYETICGGSGAGNTFAGTDAIQCHMTNSRITDPEILESKYPVVLETFTIRKKSGGKGTFVGGNGAIRAIRFTQPMTTGILSSNRAHCPQGIHGGNPGLSGNNYIIRANGTKKQLNGCTRVDVNTGDTIVIETPGGGGYGAK